MNKIYYAADIHRKHEKNQTITKYILYKKKYYFCLKI